MPRRFQFSLLDLLVLTLWVAVLLVPLTMLLRRDTTNDRLNDWIWQQAAMHEEHNDRIRAFEVVPGFQAPTNTD